MTTDLHADCANCFALCCTVTAFGEGEEFAFSRSPGEACRNLQEDYRCAIHVELRDVGMKGCTSFDCFGAGQKTSNVTFQGRSWRQSAVTKTQMILAFSVMRPLHQMLWYLTGALSVSSDALALELNVAIERIELLTEGDARSLFKVSADRLRTELAPLFKQVSLEARAAYPQRFEFAGADLAVGALMNADLRGADLSNSSLLGTDFRDSNFGSADLMGAQMLNANFSGAKLADALYLTQMQVNSARGDAHTTLPSRITRPTHWA